ncbi:MAG: outer membrane beta-barrel domain-containing protein [Bdellovibrionales bacterium]|nr:outer membrane beta-barrel domain-containing protein [Bdellovibrionales bacterium]
MKKRVSLVLIFLLPLALRAQDDIEAQLEKKGEPQVVEKKKAGALQDLQKLGSLSPFSDVAVIQRKYLPHTGRFEFYPSIGAIANQAFFATFVLSGRLGYHLNESFALEGNFALLTGTERSVTVDLREKRDVVTKTFVNPKSYYGLDLKWTPVYGKMAWLNQSIVPFDMYFVGGAGRLQTNLTENPIAVHLGTGQSFALSKSMAVRWDLSWYIYQTSGSGSFNDIHFTTGVSFFFPGAKYR